MTVFLVSKTEENYNLHAIAGPELKKSRSKTEFLFAGIEKQQQLNITNAEVK